MSRSARMPKGNTNGMPIRSSIKTIEMPVALAHPEPHQLVTTAKHKMSDADSSCFGMGSNTDIHVSRFLRDCHISQHPSSKSLAACLPPTHTVSAGFS